jgi:hypothetical protein
VILTAETHEAFRFMGDNNIAEENRVVRMAQMAQELCDREGARAHAEGILQAPDMVSVFAAACAMSVVRFKQLSDDLASELAGTALRTILKNLMFHGVEIPPL